jgi:hypothetical protein
MAGRGPAITPARPSGLLLIVAICLTALLSACSGSATPPGAASAAATPPGATSPAATASSPGPKARHRHARRHPRRAHRRRTAVRPRAAVQPAAAYCRRGGAALWANLAGCDWPGPGNTGPDLAQCPGGRLTPDGGSLGQTIEVTTANTVISCKNITGILNIEAPGVIVKNSVIESNSGKTGESANGTADIAVQDGASATIDQVRINGDDGVHACIWDQGTSMVVDAVDCHGVDDGIFSWADSSYSSTTGDHFVIRNSYFHDFTTATSNGHEDGYQTEGASDGLIEHNTYRMTTDADSAIGIWDSLRDSRDISVTDNLITGGGFAIYAEDYSPGGGGPGDASAAGAFVITHITFTDNVFSTNAAGCVGQFGIWFARPGWAPYNGGPTDGWHRRGNRVLETGQSVDGGNPVNQGQLCT